MSQIECPYCKKSHELDTANGHGCSEDRTYYETCVHCNKEFSFTTIVILHHESKKCKCLNGGKHRLKLKRVNAFNPELEFKCVTCESVFKPNTTPVLQNLLRGEEVSSDFKFKGGLFNTLISIIRELDMGVKRSIGTKTKVYWLQRTGNTYRENETPEYKRAKSLLEETKSNFAKLFPDQCADIYRC